jgi:hypothetical protein
VRRNCLSKYIIEGKIEGQTEVRQRQGRRRKQLLDTLKKEKRRREIEIECTRSQCGELALEEAMDLS